MDFPTRKVLTLSIHKNETISSSFLFRSEQLIYHLRWLIWQKQIWRFKLFYMILGVDTWDIRIEMRWSRNEKLNSFFLLTYQSFQCNQMIHQCPQLFISNIFKIYFFNSNVRDSFDPFKGMQHRKNSLFIKEVVLLLYENCQNLHFCVQSEDI
jgi:hypothetical protein